MLLEAVGCVEAQTYGRVEMILVDDGSTDGTGRLCDELAARSPEKVRALHQANAGPGAAREAGRNAARGEFLQYLDSDDWLDPRKVELQVENAPTGAGGRRLPPARRASSGSAARCRIARSLRTGEPVDAIFPAFLAGRLWQTVTPLWRHSASERIGPWTSLRVEEDMEYDARAGAEGVKPAWCPEWLAEHRHHEGPRASGGGTGEPAKLADRAMAHALIYRHALRARVEPSVPEMQRYARELFLLARQCGAAGLGAEAKGNVPARAGGIGPGAPPGGGLPCVFGRRGGLRLGTRGAASLA